jgi:hypothetical protein
MTSNDQLQAAPRVPVGAGATVAAMLAAGQTVLDAKAQARSEQIAKEMEAAQPLWDGLREAAAAELGELVEQLPWPGPPADFAQKAASGYMARWALKVRPFGAAAVLVYFEASRDQSGATVWAADRFEACTDYAYNRRTRRPRAGKTIRTAGLPEAVAICNAETDRFNAAKVATAEAVGNGESEADNDVG